MSHMSSRIWPLLIAAAAPLLGQPVIQNTSPLPTGMVSSAYNVQFTSTGGTGTVTYTVNAGSTLPPGLSLTAQGALSGTPTTTTGSPFSFTIRATDSASPTPQSTTKAFTLTVLAQLTVTSASPLPSATQNTAYNFTVVGTGGQTPYQWAASGLPNGLNINTSSGQISGTPTVSGSFPTTVTLLDSTTPQGFTTNKQFALTVNSPLNITTASPLPAGTIGTSYSQTLVATGGSGGYTWSVVAGSGSLPPGLSLTPATGQISGTPQLPAANAGFTIRVTDSSSATFDKPFTLNVTTASLTITTNSPLPAGTQGTPYTTTLVGSGGTATGYQWTLQSGSVLPNGLTLAPGTGIISGTPAVGGTFPFTVVLMDSGSNATNKAFSLTLAAAPLTITTNSPLPAATQGAAYTTTLAGSGGTGTGYIWGVQAGSNLPNGLTLNPSTGVLSGTPTGSGTANFTLTLTDSAATTTPKAFSLTIAANPVTITTTSPLPTGTVNTAYTTTLVATGGSGSGYIWSLQGGSGNLPAGLSLTPATGVISGTPSAQGTSNFTVVVIDSGNNTTNKPLSLTINPQPLTITTASPLPSATQGSPYTTTLVGAGGSGAGYQWTLQAGSTLPGGLSLGAATGIISGSPANTGTANFTVVLTDSSNASVTKPFALTVNSNVLTVTTASPLPTGTAGAGYNTTFAATGGSGAGYVWTVSPGSQLPAGLNLSTAGVLSGTPSTSGGFNFSVRVTDSIGGTADKPFALTIGTGPPTISTSTLPSWTTNRPYSQTLVGAGGTQPYTWTVSQGTLPAGLTLAAATGILAGTPTGTGTSTFTIQLADANTQVTKQFSITINAAPSITTTTLPNGSTGTAYSSTLAATGGTTPLTFAVTTGSLHTGLTLSTSGAITGTPTTVGPTTFTVTATDAAGATATRQLTLTIVQALTITNAPTLPTGIVGSAYNVQLAAIGGTGTGYAWALAPLSSPLPPGLGLNTNTGLINGTPSSIGTYSFSVRVTDSGANVASLNLTLTVVNTGLAITSASPLPQAIVGTPYTATLTATGGSTSGYVWTLAIGLLPAGLQLSPSGVISGTPVGAGVAQSTIEVRDSLGNLAQRQFVLSAASAPLTISNSSPLADGLVGVAYSVTLQAAGGNGSGYGFSIVSGSLPAGLLLSGNIITGTPAATGTSNFTVQVSDGVGGVAPKPFTITVNASNLSITTASLPSGMLGAPYSATLAATGGRTPYSWSITIGLLAPGLTLDPATGAISGAPTASGLYNMTVRVTDANGLTASAALSLTIASFVITTASLPSGSVGVAYTAQLQSVGGVAPITFQIVGGTLPAGLILNAQTGVISGTPTASANTEITFVARDNANSITPNRPLRIVIASNMTITTTSPLPSGTIGIPYSTQLAVSGGSGTYLWQVTTGALPVGLTLVGGSGVISGTPSQPAGSYSFTVQVIDSLSATADRLFTITIAAGSSLTITPTALPNAAPGVAYSQTIQATGGTPPLTFSLAPGSNPLPTGFQLASNGVVSGTTAQAGTFTFTARVTDAANVTATQAFTLTVTNQLSISNTSLPNAIIGAAYNATLTGTGGTGTGYVFTLDSGTLPTGLTLAAGGLISGAAPGPAGTSTPTFRLTDSAGAFTIKQLSLAVTTASPLTITTPALPNGSVGSAYPSTTLQASGGTGAGYTWSVIGILPAGLTLSTAGVLSGAPTAIGTSQFTIQVRDSAGATNTQVYAITVSPANTLMIDTQTLPTGVINSVYSVTLTASGGSGTGYAYALVSGTLPAGLILGVNGVFNGTPTQAGTFPITVRVSDSLNNNASRQFTLTINTAGPAITTTTLPPGVINQAYSAQLAASGGSTPYLWSIISGALPAGLALNSSSGLLSGTPAATTSAEITIRVQDSLGAFATRQFSLIVAASGVTITTASLPSGAVNQTYSAQLAASGGTQPYLWTITAGVLPSGLGLNSATGLLSGTPTAPSATDLTIRVQDSAGAAATRQLTLTITAAGVTITNTALPAAAVNTAYSTQLLVSGGTAPYTWSLTAGTLPQGLTLNASTGFITGTPAAVSSTDITFRVQDALGASGTRALTLTVTATGGALSIVTTSLAAGAAGTAYNGQLTASGGQPPYTWGLSAGSTLPAGLSLTPATGLISGTPTAAAAGDVSFRVQDSLGAVATRVLTLTVTAAGGPLTITTPATLPQAVANQPYTVTLAATGGTGTGYFWTITQGDLGGLGLTGTTGVLAGTPVGAGTLNFTIQVRDSSLATTSRTFMLPVAGTGGSLQITNTTLPNPTPGVFYSQTLNASGGTPPYQWVSEGTLPPGLGVLSAGAISGLPSGTGTFSFSIRVTDAAGGSAFRTYTMTAGSGSSLSISATTLPNGVIGASYAGQLAAAGGVPPYRWALVSGTGQLPPGVGLGETTGQLTGTPTVPGNYTFSIQAADSVGGVTSRQFSIAITAGLTVTTTALPGGTIGQAYSQSLAAAGGTGTGYVWTITTGVLPPGLTLTATTGLIAGTPTTNGTSTFTVQVSDSANATATRQLSISVGATLSITTTSLPGGAIGVAYNQTLTAAGATGALQWTVTTGSLPPGLALNAATGQLTGSPLAGGSSSFTVRAQDATGASATRQFTILIGEGVLITTPTALPNAGEGVAYSQTLAAVGGQPPYTWSLSVGSLPPGLSLNASSGLIAGTATVPGNYSFIVQVTDGAQQNNTKAFTIVVTGRITILTPSQLTSSLVRVQYNEPLVAFGGAPPYAWRIASGQLPLGMTLAANGDLNGVPTSAGLFTFTVQVTDSQNGTATKNFTLNILLGLSVTSTTPLPAATAGVAFVQTLAATGGLAPYIWTLASGNLPAGLTLNALGILTGTPNSAGTFSFAVQVADSARNTALANLSITVRLPAPPPVSINGLNDTVEPAQQPRLAIALGAVYPVAISGTLTMTFTSDAAVPVDDPAVVFTNGRRTMDFTIQPNTLISDLPAGFAMQTGTVAGSIRLAVTLRAGGLDITPDPAPVLTATMARGAPVIRSNAVTARRTGAGLEVVVTGYATPREITQAVFRFSGSGLQTTELTIPLTEGARTWYQSEQSRPFGSQFTLTQQFNVQGDTSSIASVTVTLTNAQGSSPPATATFQ